MSDWHDGSEVYKTKVGLIGKIDRIVIASVIGLLSIISCFVAIVLVVQYQQFILDVVWWYVWQLTILIYDILGLVGICLIYIVLPCSFVGLIGAFISCIHDLLFKEQLLSTKFMEVTVCVFLLLIMMLIFETFILLVVVTATALSFNLFGAYVSYAIIVGIFALSIVTSDNK